APLAGSVRGSASPSHLRNAAIDLAIGSATIKGSGSVGEAGERRTATLDAPQLAELVPLLPAAIPRTLAGTLHMTAEMAGSPLVAGFDVTAKGTQIKVSDTLAIGKLDAHAAVAPSATAGTRGDFASRSLQLDVE